MPRRTAEDAAVTRAALLAVARRAFATDGYGRTTLDGVAAAAGVTRGAVHHHFGDKRALFVEVFEALEHELNNSIVAAALSASADPLEQLRARAAGPCSSSSAGPNTDRSASATRRRSSASSTGTRSIAASA